jgi:ornithine carbamoyltransferase
MSKDILSMLDVKDNLDAMIADSIRLKSEVGRKSTRKSAPLAHKNIALLFEKPSLRTKASFSVAVEQLGGSSTYMGPEEIQIGKRETASDAGKVLSRYFDAIVYRAFSHSTMMELAEAASIPVINALDDIEHPCQAVGDLLTINEKKGGLKGKKLAYIGDGNNVCNSLLLGCATIGMDMTVASPSNHKPNQALALKAEGLAKASGAKIEVVTNPFKAAENADVVYTDVWVSMGQEAEREAREKVFMPYQVTSMTMAKAKADAVFMHCMPAHRGLEVLSEVIDGERSIVFDQAENRLHAQKAILLASMQ